MVDGVSSKTKLPLRPEKGRCFFVKKNLMLENNLDIIGPYRNFFFEFFFTFTRPLFEPQKVTPLKSEPKVCRFCVHSKQNLFPVQSVFFLKLKNTIFCTFWWFLIIFFLQLFFHFFYYKNTHFFYEKKFIFLQFLR